MRYEVIEELDAWIVRREGHELGRFGDQDTALSDVAHRMKAANAAGQPTDDPGPASLSVRYRTRTA